MRPSTNELLSEPLKIAIVIGNSNYTAPGIGTLRNPENDAAGVAKAFYRLGFNGICKTGTHYGIDTASRQVVPLTDLSREDMLQAFSAFAEHAAHAEQAAVYFAGHGTEDGEDNYLLPIDAKVKHYTALRLEGLALSIILNATERANEFGFIVLDACRTNSYPKPVRSKSSLGLIEPKPPEGVSVLYAARHGQFALDGERNQKNSPFTKALLEHMETPDLSLYELARRIKWQVFEATKYEQQPWLYCSPARETEYLLKSQAHASVIIEQSSVDRIVTTQDPEAMIMALEKIALENPNGYASTFLRKLQQQRAEAAGTRRRASSGRSRLRIKYAVASFAYLLFIGFIVWVRWPMSAVQG